MSAAALNTYVTGMVSATDTLPPHEQLSHSATLPDEYLMNYRIVSQIQATTAVRWQQLNPGLFLHQLRYRTRHMARHPVLLKKSLNSWMAFRSFYQNIFPHLQQKEASIYLTTLWKRDPFKAKWTIIAAAYSKIRNTVGKPRAPLGRYLAIICPQMGIVAVDAYLAVFHWTCEKNAEGSLLFSQATAPNLHTLDQHILHSSMTEKDVVLFCGSAGYIPGFVARRIVHTQHGLLASAPIADTSYTQTASSSTPEAEQRDTGSTITTTQPTESYEWTGSISDLYHPSEGSIDLDILLRSYHSNAWDTTNIDDPQAFGTFVENSSMQDGFLAPIVPHDPKDFQD